MRMVAHTRMSVRVCERAIVGTCSSEVGVAEMVSACVGGAICASLLAWVEMYENEG